VAGANVIKSAEMTKNGKWMRERIRKNKNARRKREFPTKESSSKKVQVADSQRLETNRD
jgi:hypothetical protein